MPIQQISPPGMLDLHAVLVALTPAALAVGAAGAVGVAGRGRLGRLMAWCALGGALAVQALFLLPSGAAAAFRLPLAHGLVRVGYAPSGCALLLGLWACWRWRPRSSPMPDAISAPGWCLRVALALALPVAAVPVLLLGAERDGHQAVRVPYLESAGEGRLGRLALALIGCLVIVVAVIIGVTMSLITIMGGLVPDHLRRHDTRSVATSVRARRCGFDDSLVGSGAP
jgi:hypothetical protein